MTQPVAKDTLDNAQCSSSGCTKKHGPLFLHGKCHVGAPTFTSYEGGVLTIKCSICDELVVRIAVADTVPEIVDGSIH